MKAQSADAAVLAGSVTDPTGAVVPGAAAHLAATTPNGTGFDQTTSATGQFRFTVQGGSYVLTVEAPGFATFTSRPLTLTASRTTRLPIRLSVQSLHQEINVLDDESERATDPNNQAGALVFEGDQLALLSNDNLTLQQQLKALAGGQATFLIDGFSDGRLPPKSSIRSIRINGNPYSAYFGDLGFGRVEISTKPGTEKLHGQVNFSGTNQPLDARNPYTAVQPPFYDLQQDGNVNGPLGKKTSFFLSEAVEQLANNAVVNAAEPQSPSILLSTAVPAPQTTQTYALRFDRQFSERNFAYIRDEWTNTRITNSGIDPLVLPEAAFKANTLTNTLQMSDTQVLGAHAVNEARFQYLRTRLRQDPNTTTPSVIVEGTFQGGGNPGQVLRDNQDEYEMQDLFEVDHGKHSMRAGFRLRALRDANESTAGFNGQYIFADVPSYLAGQASQYSQTVGQPGAVLVTTDLGVFAEDDWKISRALTLSYGFRFESDSGIPDHSDPSPRIGFAWAVRPGQRKTPIVTFRGGYGIFYAHFPTVQLLQSVRQNGVRQVAYLAQNTGFDPNGAPPGSSLTAGEPTIYQVSPRLRSSYYQAGSLTALRSLGRFGSVSGNLVYQHDTHDYLTRNLNAPLPGTVDPTNPGSGVRPLGNRNLYAFSSDGNGNIERFYLNYRVQLSSRVFGFGVYDVDKNYNETDSVDRFPSNEFNLRQDYARSRLNRTNVYTGGFIWTLPFGMQVMPFLVAHSGAPFDITTGTDLNGDTVYNDRPAFGTNLSSTTLVRTAFGNFDVQPAAGQRVIPRNYGTAPGYVWLQLRAGKDFHLGPRPQAAATQDGKPAPVPDRPWDLNFGVEVHNLTNHNNPGLPVGILSAQPCSNGTAASCTCAATPCPLAPSPYFGHSLSLASDFSPITASNRTILLQTSFTW